MILSMDVILDNVQYRWAFVVSHCATEKCLHHPTQMHNPATYSYRACPVCPLYALPGCLRLGCYCATSAGATQWNVR